MVRLVSGSRSLSFRVVGLTFVDAYPENVLAVGEMVDAADMKALGWTGEADASADVPVVLIRNPDNEHDANAVEVHVPSLGRRRSMIGHVPRDLAERLAPSLDRGDVWHATVAAVLVTPEHPDRPGVEVQLERAAQVAA